MAEETEEKVTIVEPSNPFDESKWVEQAIEKSQVIEEKKIELTEQKKEEDEIVDETDFFTKEFGVSKEDLKKERDELKELRGKQSEALKFANEGSERYFNAIKEGKEDDIYNILAEKKQLEKAEKLDPSKPKDAAEIIKLDLLYKNKDKGLDQGDIDFLFEEKFSVPEKPSQGTDQTDEDYAVSLERWESQKSRIEKRLLVEAKMAKPEFAKYKQELVLPDIPKPTLQQQEQSQESLDAIKAARDKFLTNLESGYKDFDGFSTKVKDESVEIPISFKAPEEDRLAIKKIMEDFHPDTYFQKRWLNADGSVNVKNMAADLYSLEFRDKINQGIANNAASQRLIHERKTKSNIKLDNSSNNTNLKIEPKDNADEQAKYLFANA